MLKVVGSNLHREVGFFIRTHIKKSLKNVNKKGTCKFNINLFIIITGSIPLLANYRSALNVERLENQIMLKVVGENKPKDINMIAKID
jgi:hypothetical protein